MPVIDEPNHYCTMYKLEKHNCGPGISFKWHINFGYEKFLQVPLI